MRTRTINQCVEKLAQNNLRIDKLTEELETLRYRLYKASEEYRDLVGVLEAVMAEEETGDTP